ncbi:hypothetical protein TSUD_365450 [Trifolium subterraneum]|uniref:Uncharacterized protein n=1 Tax=Trifolium subterraneum TaxID=3900 RepID=A0A2Z6MYR4_TRISU|nr:hypothetical protein TSUD_365450 [Trifolium subterraneum]
MYIHVQLYFWQAKSGVLGRSSLNDIKGTRDVTESSWRLSMQPNFVKQGEEPKEDVDFYARSKESISNGERTTEKPLALETRMKFNRHVPEGEFISVQLDDNPTRSIKIWVNLPPNVEENLVRCLKANTNNFDVQKRCWE